MPKQAGDPFKKYKKDYKGTERLKEPTVAGSTPEVAPTAPSGGGTAAEPPTPADAAPPAAAKSCADHLQQLVQHLAQSQAAIEAYVKAKYPQGGPQTPAQRADVMRAVLDKKFGKDSMICPLTKTAYILDQQKMQADGFLGLAADASAHPDGSRLVLMQVPGANGQPGFVVASIVAARKQMAVAKYRLPNQATPEGQCLRNLQEVVGVFLRLTQEGTKFPDAANSLELRKLGAKFRPAATADKDWICPITSKPYTVNPEVIKLGLQALQQYQGQPMGIVYDADAHPDGSRCVFLTAVPRPIRVNPDEWTKLKH